MTDLTLELFLAIFIPFLGLALGLVYLVLNNFGKVSGDVSQMRGSLDTLIAIYGGLGRIPPPGLADSLKARESEGGSPYVPKRKNELLDAWKKGIVSAEEAKELVAYLEEDARNASGAALAAIILAIGLLGALVVVLAAGK